MKQNRNYYKKKLSFILLILTILFAVHGLFFYYQSRITRPWQLISAVLYGTLKMFVFVAPLSAEAEAPLTYEIAKWLAPILTSALVLTKLTNGVFHLRNSLLNRMSEYHLILFEKNEAADILIHNLLRSPQKYRLSLVSRSPLSEEQKKYYEEKGVAVFHFEMEGATQAEIDEFFRKIRVDRAFGLIFGSAAELENYSLFTRVLGNIRPERAIRVFVRCSSDLLPLYFEEFKTKEQEREPRLSHLDLIPFDEQELTVRLLMKQIQGREGMLRKHFDALSLALQKDPALHAEGISLALGKVRFLIIGVSSLIPPLLRHLANDAVLTLGEKTAVHIVDLDAEEKMKPFLSANETITNALDIRIRSLLPAHRAFEDFLRELAAQDPPTAVFFLSEEAIANLEALKAADLSLPPLPKLLRNASGADLSPMLAGYSDLRIFGGLEEIMTEEVLIRSALDKRAKDFNESYNRSASIAGLGQGSPWEELSQTKKISSRASASHARIKEDLIRLAFPEKSDPELRDLLEGYLQVFQEIEAVHSEDPAKFRQRLLLFLSRHPLLDFLSRLEHKRWCSSYYAMNFRYGKVKDERRRTHPCLIDDWEKIIGEEFHSCHPEYDLISCFALFPKEDR